MCKLKNCLFPIQITIIFFSKSIETFRCKCFLYYIKDGVMQNEKENLAYCSNRNFGHVADFDWLWRFWKQL